MTTEQFIAAIMVLVGVLSIITGTLRTRRASATVEAFGLQGEGVGFLVSAIILAFFPGSIWAWGSVVAVLLVTYTIGMFHGSHVLKARAYDKGKTL